MGSEGQPKARLHNYLVTWEMSGRTIVTAVDKAEAAEIVDGLLWDNIPEMDMVETEIMSAERTR